MRHSAWLLVLLLSATPSLKAQTATQQEKQTVPPTAAPVPNPSGVYKPGGSVTTPKILHSTDPRYSKEARKKNVQGVCVLSLIIGVDGVPSDIKVLRSISAGLAPDLQSAGVSLDQKAMEAVRHYRFAPATLDGRPVPVEIHIEVNFQLV